MPDMIPFVEFFGGPLDGYRREVAGMPDTLAPEFELEISENTFRTMTGVPRAPAAVATSTVVYELVWLDARPRYYFVGALKPLEKRFS
jgi:hypothetical protein